MRLITRDAWGARPARERVAYLAAPKGVKVHYTGTRESELLLGDHTRCAARVRGIQDAHMDGNGWDDIGYSAVVCPHGSVFSGRGPHRLPAANGPGLNAGHYAVCGLVGNKGLVRPTRDMLIGIRQAIDWLRREGDAGDQIRGHRDGYPTSCPGDILYAWVRRGAPMPWHEEEDDVPEYVSVLAGKAQPIAPGEWRTIAWHREAADRSGQHPDAGGPGLLTGPALYAVTAQLAFTGVDPGTDLQVRAVESEGADVDAGPISEYKGTLGKTFALYSLAMDKVQEGKSVRLQVVHWQDPVDGAVELQAGSVAKLGFWR